MGSAITKNFQANLFPKVAVIGTRPNYQDGHGYYGWTGQQSGSGFINLAPSILHYNWF
jgi:hypothetical protein